jgi:dolichol-phosphate mannosyltransferase
MVIYIVIPTYNEAENIELLVNSILESYPNFNILIVDDNSPDGTGDIADHLARRNTAIHVLHRPNKQGLGRAYIAGFKAALDRGADVIFEMDADFSHDPKYLQEFLIAMDNADLVIGSRYLNGVRVEGWRFRRLLLSKLANIYVSYIMVKPVWDFTSGFRCYRRKVLEKLILDHVRSDGYAFQIEMTHLTFKHGFRVREIPILFREREQGYSKISRRVVMEAFWITLKCHAPLKEIIRHLSFLFRDYDEFVKSNSTKSGQ